MKYTIEKSISFEAGHRLMDYKGPCKNIHGHNYIIKIGLSNKKTNNGMIVDFSAVKRIVKKYIDEKVDHSTIFNIKDEDWIKIFRTKNQKIYIIKENPTAEELAKHFYYIFKEKIEHLSYIGISETPTSMAIYGE